MSSSSKKKSAAASTSRKRQRQKWKASSLPFKADYNDHFETPEVAYRDILPLLDFVCLSRDSHVLYDPFYCNGRTKRILEGFGFTHVIHEARDFYKDVSEKRVPVHDTLITNPPYSDQHKKKCLEFCFQQLQSEGRPFFILMPNYVASRDYYRQLLHEHEEDVVYVLPSNPYEYDHPEGTGHETPPFASIWYCGIGKERVSNVESYWNKEGSRPRLVTTLHGLETLQAIPTRKRPNPRQRRKRRKQQLSEVAGGASRSVDAPPPQTTPARNSKKSRHRNENGERTRKRF